MLDLLLTQGVLIDGTGSPPCPADVGIVGGHIVALGALRQCEAHQVLDVSGLFITPGFIEPHRYPEGIHHVIVNGRFVVRDSVQTDELPGLVLRGH